MAFAQLARVAQHCLRGIEFSAQDVDDPLVVETDRLVAGVANLAVLQQRLPIQTAALRRGPRARAR